MAESEEKLLARLGGDDKALLHNLLDAQGQLGSHTAVSNFVYGFRLGLLMTAEAFLGSEDLLTGE